MAYVEKGLPITRGDWTLLRPWRAQNESQSKTSRQRSPAEVAESRGLHPRAQRVVTRHARRVGVGERQTPCVLCAPQARQGAVSRLAPLQRSFLTLHAIQRRPHAAALSRPAPRVRRSRLRPFPASQVLLRCPLPWRLSSASQAFPALDCRQLHASVELRPHNNAALPYNQQYV